MDEDRAVSVLYTFYENMDKYKWKYGLFPDRWTYRGGGGSICANTRTNTCANTDNTYSYDECFIGPKISRNAMHYVLERGFKELHDRKIIKRYKICNLRVF